MKEEYVSFVLAKKLKEKGFDMQSVDVHGKFDTDGLFHSQLYVNYAEVMDDAIIAPSIAQVLKWLRKEHGIHIEITAAAFGYSYIISKTPALGGMDIHYSKYEGPNDGGAWNEWEDCATAAIEYVIDNLI